MRIYLRAFLYQFKFWFTWFIHIFTTLRYWKWSWTRNKLFLTKDKMKKKTEINYYNPKEWNNFLITMTAYEWNDYKAVVIIEDHKSRIKLNNSNCMLSLSYSVKNLNISKLSMYVLRISPESNHDGKVLLRCIYIIRILDINIVFISRTTNWKKVVKIVH